MKETGKALVAWDQWGKNPARAAGAVTFNVLTTVFTGGAGGAAAGAGKAGAVAKALSVAGKAGRVIDPMTYIAKGGGAGLSKIGDISAALKGVGNIDIPKLPENAVTLPEGTVMLPDGTVHLPDGAAVPEGATKLPDGNVRLPDDAPVLPEGTTKLPTEDGAPARYYDPDGNILDEHGNVLQKSADGPGDVVDQPGMPGTPASGADTPRVDSPAQQPALVGAGAHSAEQAGQHIRLGNSLDDGLSDVGRVPDNGPPPVVHTGDGLPGNTVGDHMAGGTARHTPGGHAGDHMPTNELDNPLHSGRDGTPGSAGRLDTPSIAGHTDGPSMSGTRSDGPGTNGTHSDGLGTSGGHHEPPAGSGHPAGLDDAARGADGTGRGESSGNDAHDGSAPPPHESNSGTGDKKPGLIRQDDHFDSEHNSKGQRKSHLNANGDLVPANPEGSASVVDHVVGRDPAKSDSPFTSLSAEGANAKAFGSARIRVDLERLERDIANGRVDGVEIYSPERVQSSIQQNANEIAGRHVDLAVPPGTTRAEAVERAQAMGLSKSKAKRIAQRMIDMMNTRRDEEWLIKGVVPHEYIEGPFGG
jgi:hypothetical protein